VRTRLLVIALAAFLAFGLSPAGAFVTVQPSVFASANVTPAGAAPSISAISTQFASDAPIMYVSTLRGIDIYDISDPRLPVPLSTLPMAFFQNEAMTLGERADGTKLMLIGIDLFHVTPTAMDANVTGSEIIVVDVTDPTAPEIASIVSTSTSTHTVTCANAECTHAYTVGGNGVFEVVDLTDITAPTVVGTRQSPAANGFSGHDWDIDAAGIAWNTVAGGAAAFDVTDPENPVLLNSTTRQGTRSPWNDFIHHNSLRPDADQFASREPEEQLEIAPNGTVADLGELTADDFRPGEILLVTEEDYIDVTCASEGSFQTWFVQELDPEINPEGAPNGGTVASLALWNTEILDTGEPTPAGAFCSAHYFDYHQDGFVAQGWYQQGLRILDVRDPLEIKQVGYWITAAQETWGAYWVPEYDADGVQTGERTDLVYSADHVRGVDILRVGLPDTDPEATTDLRAPILPQWLGGATDTTRGLAPDPDFGWACPIPLNR
jgi:hypothetical protein